MTKEERYKITSNDYAELLIEYNGNLQVLEAFKEYSIQIININTMIVYIPSSQITNQSIAEYGYSAMPSCFGHLSVESLEASGIRKLRNTPGFALRGQGVLIGIVDSGIDYTNKAFQNIDNSTRIVAIWDQTLESEDRYPERYFYGTEYSREEINAALQNENPYSVVATRDEEGHGTMVAGIAAGSEDEENDFLGVAPDSELVVVKLKRAKEYLKDFFFIPDNAVCYAENDIMLGVRYLFDIARRLQQPIVICIAIGTFQGGRDGSGDLSRYLSTLGDYPGVAVVIGAGNESQERGHYYGEIEATATAANNVELNVGENETGFSMELWGESPGIFSIDFLSPTGEYIPRIPARLKENREISFIFEETQIFIDYQIVESQTGDQLILIRFKAPTAGIWRFRVYGRGNLKKIFHIWLPMNQFISPNTYFVNPNSDTTVLSPGTALVPITVTAYNPVNESLFLNASHGYSRINLVTPQIAAPGVNVLAPNLEDGYTEFTGTSVAAAHTTGVVAMIMEWGIVKGNYPSLDSKEVKNMLLRGAKRSPQNVYPNKEWGYGILDIYNVYDVIRREVTV